MELQPKKTQNKNSFLIMVALLLGLVVLFCVAGTLVPAARTPSIVSTATRRPAVAPANWAPPGYKIDGTVAWRWLKTSEFDCTYSSGGCFGMEVIAKDGCSDLYGEVAIYDASQTQIDWTNDSAKGLPPGGKAKLIFDTFEDAARTASLSELSCY